MARLRRLRSDGKALGSTNTTGVPKFAHYVFSTDSSKSYIESYPVASIAISFLMKEVTKSIAKFSYLHTNVEAINYLTSLHGDALITLIYSKPIQDNLWKETLSNYKMKLV